MAFSKLQTLHLAGNAIDVRMPKRSALYHLAPIGIGTHQAESMTSYVCRLAQAHHVTPSKLFTWALNQSETGYARKTLAATDPLKKISSAYLWNAIGPNARALVDIFAALTMCEELILTTMLRYEAIISNIPLCRKMHAWCPFCLQERLEQGLPIYEPLVWYLKDVNICLSHGSPLFSTCPNGCTNLPTLSCQSIPGHCPKCATWLGFRPSHRQSIHADANEYWIAKEIGSMIAVREQIQPQMTVKEMIRLGADCLFQGHLAHFGKHIGKSKTTVWTWVNGNNNLRLKDILRISYAFQVPALDLIQGNKDCWSKAGNRPVPPSSQRQAFKEIDWQDASAYVDKAINGQIMPLPSVTGVAKHLGISGRRLRYHFPNECSVISKNYLNNRTQMAEQHLALKEAEIRQAIVKLLHIGIEPSARQLAIQMSKTNIFWKWPENKNILKKLWAEFGIGPGST